MPRPRNNLIENFYEKKDSNQCSCVMDNCNGKLLSCHAANLERHLRLVHPNIYADYIPQKEKIFHRKMVHKMKKSEHFKAISSLNDESFNKIQIITNKIIEQSKVPTKNSPACAANVRVQTIAQQYKNDPMLVQKAGELWTIKLQSMDSKQALLAEKLINDIIYNGQLCQLSPNSFVQLGLRIADESYALNRQTDSGSDTNSSFTKEEFIVLNQQQKQLSPDPHKPDDTNSSFSKEDSIILIQQQKKSAADPLK